jgi:hypothetical protein
MKVQGTSATSQTSSAKRATAGAAAGFSLPVDAPSVQTARTISAANSIGNVGALLAAQAIPDEAEKRRRATRRANSLLDQLDDVRVATLTGNVSKAHLANLSRTLREQNERIEDDELRQILQEVELRAEVELAKLEASL